MPQLLARLSQAFSYLLLLAAAVLLCWGLLGFIKDFTGLTPPFPLQYATFPSGLQFIQWLLITLSGGTLLIGYAVRWPLTPLAMIVLFACLATMCAIQTFDFLENPSRYQDFVLECIYYVVMSVYLVRSRRMRERFGEIRILAVGQT
ncbi:MAG: hypothetical protein AAFY02_19220 [Pseudomonadota bacterium]